MTDYSFTLDECLKINQTAFADLYADARPFTSQELRLRHFFERERFGCQDKAARLLVKILTGVDVDALLKHPVIPKIPSGTKIPDGSIVVMVNTHNGDKWEGPRLFMNEYNRASAYTGYLYRETGIRQSSWNSVPPRCLRPATEEEIKIFFKNREKISFTHDKL